jgi:deglycase
MARGSRWKPTSFRERPITSWPSLKTDLRNAGANRIGQAAVVDNGLITSRKPDDIPAFNSKMIEQFRERTQEPQPAGSGRGSR